jgi:hypothetical protein
MTVSMYTVSIPVFIQHLNGLNTVLEKAATWAAARKVNETDLLDMRLSPDMFNLARQVRAATPSGQTRQFTGQSLLLGNSLPNFYFHTTTAYDIVRQCGVEIGKRDFMGTPPT